MIDLTNKIIKQANKRKPRKLHRYNASEIWGLLTINRRTGKLYTSAEEWLKGKDMDFKNAYRVFNGTWKHLQIQSLLPEYEQEVKKVIRYRNFKVVGKADLLGKEVIEIKTSEKVHNKAKEWHLYQARLYAIIFKRPCVIVQPVVAGDKLLLKELGRVKPNQSWFEKTMEMLKEKDDEITRVNDDLQIIRETQTDEEAEEHLKELEELADKEADMTPERVAEAQFEDEMNNQYKHQD